MTLDDVHRALRRMAHEIIERHRGTDELVLAGIANGGLELSRMLAETIGQFENTTIPNGKVDVGPYRDDLDHRPRTASTRTNLPIPIDERKVVVVDDVLYTGRTVRAALDALSDVGRAKSTELAVLIDRGHRELPIRADYVGKNLPTSRSERVDVRVAAANGTRGVWIVDGASG